MPYGDKTGPMGEGPMTGRGAGFCAGYGAPGYMTPSFGRGYGPGRGRGFGYGMGMGRGWRHRNFAGGRPGWGRGYGYHRFHAPIDYVEPEMDMEMTANPADELKYLKQQARRFEKLLNDVNKRMEELNKEESGKE